MTTFNERKRGKRTRGNAPKCCLSCQDAHPGQRWCDRCSTFESSVNCPIVEQQRGAQRKLSGAVRAADAVRRDALVLAVFEYIAPAHDAALGQCMCCYRFKPAANKLVIDHDHDCCPVRVQAHVRHFDCTRGLICQECNVMEGKVRTVYGPPFPRLIQEYLDRYAAFRAQREAAPT